jgi:valyl-tRNA synthetase
MAMLGMKFAGGIPFRDVFVTPLVFDMHGRKMSKSLGNSIDPLDLIAKYGADATRLGIVRQMRLESQELRFDERFCQKARDFNTKMWNALRYVRSLPEGLPSAATLPRAEQLTLADRWILTKLRALVERVTEGLDRYDLGPTADALLEFVWYEFCDWYLEATKVPSPTRAPVLSYVLNVAMRLLHPFCPFVSEEIWLALPHDGLTIVTASWPDPREIPSDPQAAARYERLKSAVAKVRDMRVELGFAPSQKLTVEVPAALDPGTRSLLAQHANATIVELAGPAPSGDPLASVAVRAPAALLRARYVKEEARLESEVERLVRKLGNAGFTSKASSDVVAKEREKLAGYEQDRDRVRALLAGLDVEGATQT